MTVISLTLPDELLKAFDEFVKARGYYSRSEAIRDAIRGLIDEASLSKTDKERIAATIMVICEYEKREVDRRVTDTRHEFDDVVVENIHRHIDKKYCLEILIAEGNASRILDLIGRIRGMRGIYQVKAVFMPL